MTARDWSDALLFISILFLALGFCDPAPAAVSLGSDIHRERTMDRYLTEAEQARLLKTLKEAAGRDALVRRDDAAVRALLHSGMRLGEFLAISVGDALIALNIGYLYLPKSHRKMAAMDLSIYLTRPLRKAIEDLLKVRYELTAQDCMETDPLVVGRHGEGVTIRAFELRYKQHARCAGLAISSPHWLRHSFAMNIRRHSTAVHPMGIIQRALGHRSIASTGVYAHATKEDVEQALEETARAVDPGRITKAQLRREYERRVAA